MSNIDLKRTSGSRTKPRQQTSGSPSTLQLQRNNHARPDFTRYLLTKGFSAVTIKRYIRDTDCFLQWAQKNKLLVKDFGYIDVLHFMRSKREMVKQRTIGIQINSLKHYFNFLAVNGHSVENPTTQIQIRGIKRRTLYNILEGSELKNLYHNFAIPNEEKDPERSKNWFKASVLAGRRNKVILGLMVYQGLKAGELARLTENDIHLNAGYIFVAGSGRSENRTLTLEACQILDILEYKTRTRIKILQQAKIRSDKFFVSLGTGNCFNNIMHNLMQKVQNQNRKVTSARQIRASVLSNWLKIYNLRQVQYMAGHRFVSSTEAYLINNMEDLMEEVNTLHPLNAKGAI